MRKFLLVFLSLLLFIPAALAAPEPVTLALKAVTYAVDWTYYDGNFAQVGLRQTPNDGDVALVDALSYDPSRMQEEPMSVAAAQAGQVIGSYCEVDFIDPAHPEERPNNSGGSLSADGRGLSGEVRFYPTPGEAPNLLEAWVTVGVRTQAEQTYDEMETFILPLPKTDSPLLDAQPDLDLGSTRVDRVIVSRTPDTLVVRVIHAPSGPHDPSPFVVAFEKGTALRSHEGNTFQPHAGGLGSAIHSFWLDADTKLPTTLRLSYHGATADLLVDLEAGTVTSAPK